MAVVDEIDVLVNVFVEKATKQLQGFRRVIDGFASATGAASRDISVAFSRAGLTADMFVTRSGKLRKNIDPLLSRSLEMARRASMRFKFEWLGLLFAGQSISQMFENNVRTVLDWVGTNEIFAAAINLSILQAIDPFIDKINSIGIAILDSSREVRSVIGWGAIFSTVFGKVLSLTSQIFLLLASLKILGVAIPSMQVLLAGLAGSFSAVLSVVGALTIALGALKLASEIGQTVSALEKPIKGPIRDASGREPFKEIGAYLSELRAQRGQRVDASVSVNLTNASSLLQNNTISIGGN
jgi:hypothetical protein